MWGFGVFIVAFLVIGFTNWVYKWRNPKCKGVLPPGSMGLPIIGETVQFLYPSYSMDQHPFLKNRFKRYGPIFKTSFLGRPAIVSSDPEFNSFILQQEGKLVHLWYLDSLSKVLGHDTKTKATSSVILHKLLRNFTLTKFGAQNVKQSMLAPVDQMVRNTVSDWCLKKDSFDVRHALSVAVCNFVANQLFSYESESSRDVISETFDDISHAFYSLPFNLPGTRCNKGLKARKKVVGMLHDIVKKRMDSSQRLRGDLLDQIINDLVKENMLTVGSLLNTIFVILFASFDTVSTALALALKLIADDPLVIEELRIEHEKILKNREADTPLSWEDYTSMTFTHKVICEALRLVDFSPGLPRRAITDINLKGYTIPAGWVIMCVVTAVHFDPAAHENPLKFNPWRWKGDLEFTSTSSSNWVPFGGGARLCPGSVFGRLIMANFIHVLMTKYRWGVTKEVVIKKAPGMSFGEGILFKVSPKN